MALQRQFRSSSRRLSVESLESRFLCASDWQNAAIPADVDGSGLVEPLDAVIVINELKRSGIKTFETKPPEYAGPLRDVNGDNSLSPIDILLVINSLSRVDAGDVAPNVRLPNQDGEMVDLASFVGKNAVVLYFYPKDNTPGCTVEALDFSARKPEFESLGAKIFGVSLDSVDSHESFASDHKLSFDILADTEKKATTSFGVLTETSNGTPIAKRTTFIIGKDGIIKKAYTDVQVATHGGEVADDLRAGVAG